MTAEEKREQLLKRILPGLAITIIYFVFVSGLLSEKMTKAEEKYQNMVRSGVSQNAMSGVMTRQSKSQQQIRKLESENRKYAEKLKELAGFLSADSSSNASATLLSNILAKNNIKTQKEERESITEEQLTPALKEVWKWLKPPESKDAKKAKKPAAKPSIYVQHLWLKGSYQQLYNTMNAIAKSDLQVLPVTFTMRTPEQDESRSGELEWELVLWM